MIAQAGPEHMCNEVHLARAEQFASTAPAASVPSMSTAASSDVGKAPKTLPKNYWADMVADYESVKINGENRKFPAHLLLGAEEVLARMVHEHQTSKIFTPVRLGEIIAVRNFTTTGQVNPGSKNEDKPERVLLEAGRFVRQPRSIPETQKALTVLDALDSVKWAMIFAKWGS